MSGSNVAHLPFIKDGDGNDGDEPTPFQIVIDVADNGFILNVMGTEDDGTKVFVFHGKGDQGPEGMIQEIISRLGIVDKVKLAK